MDKIANESFLLTLLLIYFRVVVFVFMLPFFGSLYIPNRIKLFLSFSLSFVILSFSEIEPVKVETFYEFLSFALNEFLFGFVSAFILRFIFEAVVIAGEIVAVHSGLGFLQMFLPGQVQMTVFSGFFSIYATVLFLSLGGAEILILAISESIKKLPVGSFNLFSLNPEVYLNFFYESFNLGVKVSLPVLITALLFNIVLAVVNRFIPQMNVFMVGLPVQVFLGLLVLILSLPVITYVLSEHFSEFINFFVKFVVG